MDKNNSTSDCCDKKYFFKKHHHSHGGGSNPIYGLGVVGSLFYFLQNATTFNLVMIGIGKSIFWPAVVIFKVLSLLHL